MTNIIKKMTMMMMIRRRSIMIMIQIKIIMFTYYDDRKKIKEL